MTQIHDLLNQPGGAEVLWDYCLENDLCLPYDYLPYNTYLESPYFNISSCNGVAASASNGPGNQWSRQFKHKSMSGNVSILRSWSAKVTFSTAYIK